jgi:endonuclease/exonuclease/phosphatase (EEP) superfamily protein YafD
MTTSTRRPVTPSRPLSRTRSAATAFAAGVTTLLAAAVLLPDRLGLDGVGRVIQLLSFRPQVLAAEALLLVPTLVAAWRWRGLWPVAAGLGAVVLVGGALVLPRAVPDPVPTDGRALTVLSFNVYEGQADVDAFAALIRAERPDLVAMPEAGSQFAGRLAPLIEPLGYRMFSSAADSRADVANVVAAVADGLGPVQVRTSDAGAAFPHVEVTGGALGGLRFAAVHTQAPVKSRIVRWRSDLAGLGQWCAAAGPTIVAGDLNATLDHEALRAGMVGCADAAAQRGAALIPTWSPSAGTRLLGPQIDHVLVSRGIEAETFGVHELPGSDHSAILTRLRLPA